MYRIPDLFSGARTQLTTAVSGSRKGIAYTNVSGTITSPCGPLNPNGIRRTTDTRAARAAGTFLQRRFIDRIALPCMFLGGGCLTSLLPFSNLIRKLIPTLTLTLTHTKYRSKCPCPDDQQQQQQQQQQQTKYYTQYLRGSPPGYEYESWGTVRKLSPAPL